MVKALGNLLLLSWAAGGFCLVSKPSASSLSALLAPRLLRQPRQHRLHRPNAVFSGLQSLPLSRGSRSSSSSFSLAGEREGGGGSRSSGSSSIAPSIASIVTLYKRVSWLSWWGQIILTVVGGVILTFANTVRKGGSAYALWNSGFAFSGIGALMAFLNAIWTWNMTRMSRRVSSRKIQESKIVPTLKNLSQISVTISLVGMAVTLFAAEQIVGTLASKVLSAQGLVGTTLAIGTQLNQIQALDIFLVQANTNILVAHYIPLLSYVWLQSQLPNGSLAMASGGKDRREE